MERFRLNTRESLYEPVEIGIDEKVYQTLKLTRSILAELRKLEEEIPKANEKALYQWVSFVFNVDTKILEKLDKREVEDIYFYASKKFRESEANRLRKEVAAFEEQIEKIVPKKETPELKKNVKRPGSRK